jgi:aspartyl-tRNA(Asn)/glutamyl-tRNA(Gln) amidotransferase subunit A
MDYLDALPQPAPAFGRVQDLFGSRDLVASPTMAATPLPISLDSHRPVTTNGQETDPVHAEWYPYTLAFSLTEHTAVLVPCGYASSHLPVGFQLAARWFDEAYLLDAAEQLEGQLDFKSFLKRPGP